MAWATPLLLALCMVEFADLVFAVDSVPAIFAITTDPFIVYTSNIFAILGLRALYFALAAMIHRFAYLKYALALVLSCALPAYAASPPYPLTMCPADRAGNLGCTANDVGIAELRVTNGVTTCVAGEPVTLQLQALLSSNATQRYDIGIFVARDGREITLPSASGGAAVWPGLVPIQ